MHKVCQLNAPRTQKDTHLPPYTRQEIPSVLLIFSDVGGGGGELSWPWKKSWKSARKATATSKDMSKRATKLGHRGSEEAFSVLLWV